MVPELPGTATIRRIPWLARLAAYRGSDEALELIEESASLVRNMAKGAILEALCDVIADLGRWELADDAVAEALAFAEEALLVALPLHAYRLEGRVALERYDTASAVAALTRAREGFASLGAAWEHAVAQLWLGEAQLAAGAPDDARGSAEAALGVFDALGSVRESERARGLLGRIG